MKLSRRRMMETLAGGAAVLTTGCGREAKAPVERSFVGQDPARGHLVRDATRRDLAPTERIDTDVLVIGGGVAGAAAVWRLARAGLGDVHHIELEPAAGGTARSGTMPRSPYPMGAHYLPAPSPRFGGLHTLLRDLGLVVGHDEHGRPEYDPRIVCRAPVERHRARGMWHEGIYPAYGQSDDEAAQWERWHAYLRQLDGRTGADGLRLFDLPVRNSSAELRALDRISMAAHLRQLGLTSPRLRWVVDYACRDDYGCTIEQTSAFAGLHHFLARGLEAEHDRFLLVWPEGNDHLVRAMAAAADLGDRFRPDTAAIRIDPDDGSVLAYDIANDRTVAYRAHVVLWAAPRFVLPYVLPEGRDALPHDALTYTPWLVANVEVSRRPVGIGAALAWDNVDVDGDHLGYVVANHLEPLTARRDPAAVLSFYDPRHADDAAGLRRERSALLSATVDGLSERVTNALEDMHPGITPTIRRIHLARWGHAMIRPTPGFLFGDALALARRPVGRVLPCATDVGGLPLFEEAFWAGVDAAQQALAQLGRPEPDILG